MKGEIIKSQVQYAYPLSAIIRPYYVDTYCEEQVKYYVNLYKEMDTEILSDISTTEHQIESLENQAKLKSKQIKQLRDLKIDLKRLHKKRKEVDIAKGLWEAFTTGLSGKDLANKIIQGKCYDIIASEGIFSPNEYRIENRQKGEKIYWTEIIACTERVNKTIEVRPAGTKFVKKGTIKDCQPTATNDCTIWCLEEVPAVYKDVSSLEGCPIEFEKNEFAYNCLRKIELDIPFEEPEIKIISLETNKEIRVLEIKEIDCF